MFKKHGLEVEVVYVRNSSIQMAGLSTGSFQLSVTGGAPSLSAAAAGLKLKIVAIFGSRFPYDIAGKPDIRTPEDLRGKSLGVTNVAGTTWVAAMLALKHLKLDPKLDDIRLQALGNQTLLVQALESRGIPAVLVDHLFSRQLKENGFRMLFEGHRANIPFDVLGLVVTGGYLEQHPYVVQNALKALLEAQAFIIDPAKKPIALKTIRDHLKISDPSGVGWSYQYLIEMLERKPYPSLEAIRNIYQVMRGVNPQVARVKVEDLMYDPIIRKLDENGFIDSVYGTSNGQ